MNRCVLAQVSAGIVAQLKAPLGMQIIDTLMLGPGAMLHVTHGPASDEPIELGVRHVTLRDAAGLMTIVAERVPLEPPSINVTADACAFIPRRGEALVTIRSADSPSPLLKALEWTGQGSLLAPEAPLAVWVHAGGPKPAREEVELAADGLVSSKVVFAGATAATNGSRLIGWQAPLQSAEPPGIDDSLPNLPQH